MWAQNFLFIFLSLIALIALGTGLFSIRGAGMRVWTAVLVFALLFVLSSVKSPFSESARYEAALLMGAVYFYGSVRGLSAGPKSALLKSFMAGAAILLAMYAATGYSEQGKGLSARNDLFINANMVGACSVLLFFAAIRTLRETKLFSIAAVVISLTALFFSRSVSSMLALAAGWIWFRWPEYSSARMRRKIILPVAGTIAAAVYFLREYGARSVYDRGKWWMETVRAIAEHPWTGNGPGSFQIFSAAFWTEGIHSQYAHNFFLQKAAEMGLPACILLVSLMVLLMIQCKDRFLQAACGAMLVQSFFDFSMQIPGIFLMYFLFAAVPSDEDAEMEQGMGLGARVAAGFCILIPGWFWGVKPAVAAHHAMAAEKRFNDMDFAGAEESLWRAIRWDSDSGKYYSDLAQTLMAQAESKPDGHELLSANQLLSVAEHSLTEALRRDPYSKIYRSQAQILRGLAEKSGGKK